MVYQETPLLPFYGELSKITGHVCAKLGGRLRDFRLAECDGRLILSGRCASYHVKQLAQEEVMGVTRLPIERNEIEVGRAV
jgi:hypothetical protein